MVAMVLLVAVVGYFIMNRNEDNANELFNAYGATQGDIGMGYAEFQNVKVQLRNVLYLYADSSSDQSAEEENLNTARNNMKTYFVPAFFTFEHNNLPSLCGYIEKTHGLSTTL